MSTSTTTIDTIGVFKSAAAAIYSGTQALAIISTQVETLRTAKVSFGKSVKTCEFRRQLGDAMQAAFTGKKPKTYTNYVTAFIAAVNEGIPFSFSHSKGKGKGKKKSDADKTIFPVLAKLFSHEGFAALMSELQGSYDNDEGSLSDLIRVTLESEGYEIKD
jgi:hypothetical protein